MTSDLIYKMKNSTPSLTGKDAELLVVEAFTSDKFMMFHSKVTGFQETIEIADAFITSLTTVDLQALGVVQSVHPIHVLHFIPHKDPNKEYWGLLYSNALVLYGSNKEPFSEFFILCIDKELAKEQGFESVKVQLKAE